MALHLNLNHELEREKAVRRRDPLKLSMMGLGVVVALFALNFVWKLTSMASLNHQLGAKAAELNKLAPQAEEAVRLKLELEKKLGNSDKFVKRIDGRFYWSPLLEELMRTVPSNIHLSRLGGDAGGDAIKKVQVNLDGTAAGTDPLRVAEDFRTKLAEVLGKKYRNVSSTFRSLEKRAETVDVDGTPVPTAVFAINLQLQSGEEAPAAAPAPRAAKKR